MINWEALSVKMRFKPGQTIVVINAPAEFRCALPDYLWEEHPDNLPEGDYKAGVLFAPDSAELNRLAPLLIKLTGPDGLLWIAYPKKSSPLNTDLHRDEGWQCIFDLGFRPVSQVAIDADWSAIRLRPGTLPDRTRASRPELVLDQELASALRGAGLEDVFGSLAYTHRKEFSHWISDAKKPETRLRRIAKTIEMVRQNHTIS